VTIDSLLIATPAQTIASLDELAGRENIRRHDVLATVRIERQDVDANRIVPVSRPGRLYERRDGLTVAFDHYFFDIDVTSGRFTRSYTLQDELLLVAVYAAWPCGIRGYSMKDGRLSQRPLDLELRPVDQNVADFLMLAQLRAAIVRLQELGARPDVLIRREHANPIHLPVDDAMLSRLASREHALGYRGRTPGTEYYTCPKPRLERFFRASSSGPRP
jgi:hypothetical protein